MLLRGENENIVPKCSNSQNTNFTFNSFSQVVNSLVTASRGYKKGLLFNVPQSITPKNIHKLAEVIQLHSSILTLLLTLFARLSILRLLTSLLQTTRVAQRHKVQRMHLQDAKYLGLMHLRIKRFEQVFVLSDFTFHKIITLQLPSKRLLNT